METHTTSQHAIDAPLLDTHNGTPLLLYNGIQGDSNPACGNVLTHAELARLSEQHPHIAADGDVSAGGGKSLRAVLSVVPAAACSYS